MDTRSPVPIFYDAAEAYAYIAGVPNLDLKTAERDLAWLKKATHLTHLQNQAAKALTAELAKRQATLAKDYLPFGPIARDRMNLQCQYAVRYLFETNGYPFLGVDIRTSGHPSDYHSVTIHQDDVETFLARYATELEIIKEREIEWINEEHMLRERAGAD